jgi:PiT family inorganic phosphate transporter
LVLTPQGSLIVILLLALLYGYLNGQHGSASIVATIISSRALGSRQALLLAAFGIAAGPFLLGVAVASTIARDLITPDAITTPVVISALVGAIGWSALTFWLHIPSSISQALVGGIVGAVLVASGWQAVQLPGLARTLAALFLSPVLGMIAGFWLVRLSYTLASSASPHINVWFKRWQVVVSLIMAIAFGANDGQKIMGMIVLGMLATGFVESFTVPTWVIAYSAATIAVGTLAGGWRLIHTLGGKFYKIRPIHGFGAQVASAIVMLGAAAVGGPVSGSQVVTSAIVGAGSADRIQQVRWSVARNVVVGWLLTLPLSALTAAVTYLLMERWTG